MRHPMLSLAKIIFMDGVRRHALIGLVVLSLGAEAFGLLFMDFFGRDVGRASSDFLFSIMWLAGFMFLFFHAVQSISWDEEHRAIYSILSRPISRAQYVLGVFIGLAALLLSLQLLLGTVAYATLIAIKGALDEVYFPALSMAYFGLSWLGLLLMQFVLLGAILLFSGMVRGGGVVMLLSVAYYGICSGLPVVRASILQHVSQGEGSSTMALLLQGLTAIFPDFSRLDFKDFVISDAPITGWAGIGMNITASVLYVAIAVTLACVLYARRDLR